MNQSRTLAILRLAYKKNNWGREIFGAVASATFIFAIKLLVDHISIALAILDAASWAFGLLVGGYIFMLIKVWRKIRKFSSSFN